MPPSLVPGSLTPFALTATTLYSSVTWPAESSAHPNTSKLPKPENPRGFIPSSSHPGVSPALPSCLLLPPRSVFIQHTGVTLSKRSAVTGTCSNSQLPIQLAAVTCLHVLCYPKGWDFMASCLQLQRGAHLHFNLQIAGQATWMRSIPQHIELEICYGYH